ncbi:MAG: hypothetical protein GY778_19440, partial [bacterium]|nr:hypothetical protein [bacterium]
PENAAVNFNGAWSVYPYFPSGTVIISDIDRGLFILDVSAALAASAAIPGGLIFDFPGGVPTQIDPAGGTTMQVDLSGNCGGLPQAGTGQLHYDTGGGFVTVPMADLGGGQYLATFPAVACPGEIEFCVSAQSTGGGTFSSPPDAPATLYSATAALGTTVLFSDNFEDPPLGWVATNTGASSGDWQRGIPVNDPGWEYDPISDSDGSGKCYLTENQAGNTDVDGHLGRVRLTSPPLDLTGGGVLITYDYYLYLSVADGTDKLLVEIADNSGLGAWTEIARHDTSGGLSWRSHIITEADLINAGVALSSNMSVRFTINDDDAQSIVEGGLDAFAIQTFDCGAGVESCTDGILNQDEDRIDCGGVCPACTCTTDGACDNGDFCDGAETCEAFGECEAGTDPCPGQSCDEVNDVCVATATIVSGRTCMMHNVERWCFVQDGGLPDPRLGPNQLELDLTGDVSSVSVSMICASAHNGAPTASIGAGPNGPQSRRTVDFVMLPHIDCCTVILSGDAVDQYDLSALAGDVNGSGVVNATDKNLVKGNISNAVDADKFVFDVNASGTINATDKNLTKGWIGTSAILCP